MGRLRTTLQRGFLSLLLLLAAITAAWAISRVMYPTDAQREAVAEMAKHPDHSGENAFALLWTLERDVPKDELDAVMAKDIRRFSGMPSVPLPGDETTWAFESVAENYPDLQPSEEDRNLFCKSSEEDCLAQVREDLEAHAALVDRNRKLLDRVEELHAYEYLRFEFPYRMNTPLPSYPNIPRLRTRRAVHFAQGRTSEAVSATCRDIATWRRLGASSDNLITRLFAVSNSTSLSGYMLANMLSELPVDVPLPDPCDEALAPPTIGDVSICNAMRGEFAGSSNATRNLSESVGEGDYLDRLALPLLFDAEATVGMNAEGYRSFCDQSELERLLADRRDLPDPSHQDMWRFACIGNPVGCMLNSIAMSSYAGYRHRLQDYGARLRALGTLAWMRRHSGDGRSPSELLAARPDELKSPARDIAFGPEGRTLRVPLYDTSRGEYWSIPLPPALHSLGDD